MKVKSQIYDFHEWISEHAEKNKWTEEVFLNYLDCEKT